MFPFHYAPMITPTGLWCRLATDNDRGYRRPPCRSFCDQSSLSLSAREGDGLVGVALVIASEVIIISLIACLQMNFCAFRHLMQLPLYSSPQKTQRALRIHLHIADCISLSSLRMSLNIVMDTNIYLLTKFKGDTSSTFACR